MNAGLVSGKLCQRGGVMPHTAQRFQDQLTEADALDFRRAGMSEGDPNTSKNETTTRRVYDRRTPVKVSSPTKRRRAAKDLLIC